MGDSAEEQNYWMDRDFFEKIIAALNHGTSPMMNIFKPGQRKMRITVDYDPHEEKVHFQYLTEDIGEQSEGQDSTPQ